MSACSLRPDWRDVSSSSLSRSVMPPIKISTFGKFGTIDVWQFVQRLLFFFHESFIELVNISVIMSCSLIPLPLSLLFSCYRSFNQPNAYSILISPGGDVLRCFGFESAIRSTYHNYTVVMSSSSKITSSYDLENLISFVSTTLPPSTLPQEIST